MARYSVYNNILLKLEYVCLHVEMKVDREIVFLLKKYDKLKQQLESLKSKIEILNSLKKSYELFCHNKSELRNLINSIFEFLCDQHILLRFVQEKELLLNNHIKNSNTDIPSIMQLNHEFKLRKKIQEIELLSAFLSEDSRAKPLRDKIKSANGIFDLAISDGSREKLENMVEFFDNLFDKTLNNIYNLDLDFITDFKDFKLKISLQANKISLFKLTDIESLTKLYQLYEKVRGKRIALETEIENLLYQFTMLQNGKNRISLEIKNTSGEFETLLFHEYAIEQKIRELRHYKVELNSQKDNFMKDPSMDGYKEVLHQLEAVQSRFRQLVTQRNDKNNSSTALYLFSKIKNHHKPKHEARTSYNKILFQALHNSHISSEAKLIILRLSKPSKMMTNHQSKFLDHHTGSTHSFGQNEKSLKPHPQELH
jgi:hypothetical protein